MFQQTDDLRIASLHPLLSPAILMDELPLTEPCSATIVEARRAAERIIRGEDDRLLCIVGPCSIHDPVSALEYAGRLKKAAVDYENELCIIMRVYFEKPRTTVGWKGLINDPLIDGSFQINQGLRIARKLLIDLTAMGVPAASEFLDTIIPQFIGDVISWGAIGARTTESQVHRELASGLSIPVGFKNGTDGSIQVALDAIGTALHPHSFLSVTKQGIAAIVATRGNDCCHLILRGGKSGPNYDEASVKSVAEELKRKGFYPGVMVDCSHGNSRKDHRRQPEVAQEVARQITAGSRSIFGIMLESHLVDGNQASGKRPLQYGQSITDACISWEQTLPVLEQLAKAVTQRRQVDVDGE